MRANLYIGILIGLLIFIAVQWYLTRAEKVEAFTESGTGSKSAANSSSSASSTPTTFETVLAALNADPANFKYIEAKEDIPAKEKLLLYYSTFSDKTLYEQDTYLTQSSHWNNHLVAEQKAFLLTTTSLPVSIKPPNGLPLKSVKMNVVASDKLNPGSSTNPPLESFTASFYCRFNSLQFEGTNPIEVFNIFLESPNYARLEIRPIKDDTTNVELVLQLGNKDNVYTVKKPKDALLASGNYVLLSFVYNATPITIEAGQTSSKVLLYIGNNESDNYNAVVTPKPALFLGNSDMVINRTTNLDANLQAFAYFTDPLSFTTHQELLAYFNNQQSGVSSLLNALKAMTKKQLEAVQTYVKDQTVTVEDLQKQLEECKAATPEEEKKFKYNIKLKDDMKPVSEADLESCSILGVKKRSTTKEELPVVSQPPSVAAAAPTTGTGTPATATPTTTANRFAINIPFLSNIIAKAF